MDPVSETGLATPSLHQTNSITKTIPQILNYLFETYSNVSPKELSSLKHQVESMIYDPTEPIDTVFTEIDDLSNIAESVNKPIPEDQKIDMAYITLQNTKKFTSGLRKWDKMQIRAAVQAQTNNEPVHEPSWDAFQEHFRTVHKGLKKTGELMIKNTFNKNELMSMVSDRIKQGLEHAMSISDNSTLTTENTEESNNKYHEQQQQIEQMNATIKKLEDKKKQNQWQILVTYANGVAKSA